MLSTYKQRVISLTMIFIIIIGLFTSCSTDVKFIDSNDGLFYAEIGSNKYYFENSYISKPEAKNFIDKSEKAISDLAKDLDKQPLSDYSFYIGSNLTSQTYKGKIELSGIVDKSENFAKYLVQAIMGNGDPPTWFKEGFSEYYGKKYCDWGNSSQTMPSEQLAQLILTDASRSFIDFNSVLYGSPDSAIQVRELGNSYFNYMFEKLGEDKIISLYSSFNEYSTIVGNSELDIKSQWLETLGIKHISDGTNIYYPTTIINPDFIDLGLHKTITIENSAFYYSTDYITDEQALDFSRKINSGMNNVLQFLAEAQIFPQQTEQIYILTDDKQEYDIPYDYIVLSGVLDESSSYISSLLQGIYKHRITPWVQYGVNTIIEQQFSEHENFWTEDLMDPKEVLKEKSNLQLLDFDDSRFGQNKENELKSLCTSFSEYIKKQYGKPMLMKLYNDTINFQFVVGKSFQQVVDEWLVSIDESDIKTNTNEYKNPEIPQVDQGEIQSLLGSEDGYLTYETEAVKYYFEPNYLEISEIWNFIQINEQGIKDVKSYLTSDYIDYNGQLSLYLTSDEGASSATGPEIWLNFAKEQMAEYVHESVHPLQGYYYPFWLSEGTATLINDKFSAWSTPPNYRRGFQDICRKIIFDEGYTNLLTLSDIMFGYSNTETEQNLRFRCYILAAGLCEYIEDNYGKQALFDLYLNYDQFENILGINYDTLITNWVKSLEQ